MITSVKNCSLMGSAFLGAAIVFGYGGSKTQEYVDRRIEDAKAASTLSGQFVQEVHTVHSTGQTLQLIADTLFTLAEVTGFWGFVYLSSAGLTLLRTPRRPPQPVIPWYFRPNCHVH